ncbi:MAG TPA: histidine phosphatase family protein [Bryobacteraceae bacterium]|nr:histidine phosphatase family protein [Bryobacteraceae bacterium]
MKAILVRHAAVATKEFTLHGRLPGVSLSLEGQMQARRLATLLTSWKPSAIYSSPLERTMETAAGLREELARQEVGPEHFRITVQPEPALTEIDFGRWTGKTIASLEPDPEWKRFNLFRSGSRCPGGESMAEVQLRIVNLLDRLRSRHSGEAVVLVTHAEVVRSAVCFYLGVPLDLFLRIEIELASISVLRLEDFGARLLKLNQTAGI